MDVKDVSKCIPSYWKHVFTLFYVDSDALKLIDPQMDALNAKKL